VRAGFLKNLQVTDRYIGVEVRPKDRFIR